MPKRFCNWCKTKDNLKCCAQCKLVDYCSQACQRADWKDGGHKILCVKVPKAVAKAEAKVSSFQLSDYTTRNIGTFWVTDAQADRGQIVEEEKAQDMCYDAMEMEKGSPEKLEQILRALKHFPLSTEAWGMLGQFYRWETATKETRKKECSEVALEMFEHSIRSARALNPTWTEDRIDELLWGEIENRPYLRAVSGKAQALKDVGKTKEAIVQAKKLLRWNPDDNQGMRNLLCSWYLEIGDTEGCSNLLRKYGKNPCTSLAYADVLLQFLRWEKDDVVENDVKQALYTALKANPHVPDLITGKKIENKAHAYISPGGIKDAENYALDGQKVWKMHPKAIKWLRAQKLIGGNVPSENDLIGLLKSGKVFLMKTSHTDLDRNGKTESTVEGTQRRNRCFGCCAPDFFWPRQLDQPHQASADIYFYDNGGEGSPSDRWRRTKYSDVKEVPYWNILLQFYEDDLDNDEIDRVYEDDSHEKEETLYKKMDASARFCVECGSNNIKHCAVGNGGMAFYCSESCMNDKLIESGFEAEPLSFDLNSTILEISVSYESSLRVLDLDDILTVAADNMPHLIAVDIYIDQQYILSNSFSVDDDAKRLVLTPETLRNFLQRMSTKLESFSFRLDECCEDAMKSKIDRGEALMPLGTMPNIKKLTLCNFGFDDIHVLTKCLSPKLKLLNLGHVKMRLSTWCISDVEALIGKISQMKELVSLSLSDNALTDKDLQFFLPKLKELRHLDVCGRFGDYYDVSRHCLLTDASLKEIARHCPKLQSLVISFQRKMSSAGIGTVLRSCQDLLQLEMSEINVSTTEVKDFVCQSKKLLYLLFDNKAGGAQSHEKHIIENAMKATNGRTLIGSYYQGLFDVKLSKNQQKNRDESKATVEKAWEQDSNPRIYNKWDGICSA